ncbi:MAG: beta-N-acetylhexosaminidase, partial [Omnitrophica WOR_2 bacterium]
MNDQSLLLLPQPRLITLTSGTHRLTDQALVLIDAMIPKSLHFSASQLIQAVHQRLAFNWEITASPSVPVDLIEVKLQMTPEKKIHDQGYELDIHPKEVLLKASDEPGIFYGVCTLVQLIDRYGSDIPCMHISDWPDFQARGVMLDISRDKVPMMQTILHLVDQLASWKINQLQLYTEHTFAYRQYPDVWARATPFTGQEIMELDAYCRQRYIELVPNQNSFGHFARWLLHDNYSHLAEVQGEFITPWGPMKGPYSLCPTDPASLELIFNLYDELLPHFTSRMINVGCDETFDIGQGRSKDACAAQGEARVYLDFLLSVYNELKSRGYTMQFWGDIVQLHPELIPELPRDVIALEWGYEANHPFDQHCARLNEAGIPFYVCPGTSSWCSLAGRSDNALFNLQNAAQSGLKYGATGYLITDWGDYGHWQPLPVSYLGFVAGAAYSWVYETNHSLDIPEALSQYGFKDRTGVMGCFAYELGNIYQACGYTPENASALFQVLQRPFNVIENQPKLKGATASFEPVMAKIDQVMQQLPNEKMEGSDRDIIVQEFNLVARLLRHACQRGMLLSETDEQKIYSLRNDLNYDLDGLEC